ncbi:hypothetical protein VNO80_30437 [Phaseolus coccineus]|uniref:Pre-mRNA-splicing factor SLU7 n=1 Tax=Phaseolus coccineus TaxID=3886 RepID=A0AAN9LCX0_PHACN
MATTSVAFKSREDHRKQIELEEARKAGLAPAEFDEDGKEINPHLHLGSSSSQEQWGYKCCKLTIPNTYCTGAAGIEAAFLAEAFKKEDLREREGKDQRKRKYNVTQNNEVTLKVRRLIELD